MPLAEISGAPALPGDVQTGRASPTLLGLDRAQGGRGREKAKMSFLSGLAVFI